LVIGLNKITVFVLLPCFDST